MVWDGAGTGSWDETLHGISSALRRMPCVQSASGRERGFPWAQPPGYKGETEAAEGEALWIVGEYQTQEKDSG